MTKAATMMTVILAVFAVAYPAAAFGGKSDKDKGKSEHHGHEGTVSAVNTAKKTITLEEHLKDKTEKATYPVDDDAKIDRKSVV